MTDPRLLLLSPDDTVFVLRDQIAAGEMIVVEGFRVRVQVALGLGHKIARRAVAAGVLRAGRVLLARWPYSTGLKSHSVRATQRRREKRGIL